MSAQPLDWLTELRDMPMLDAAFLYAENGWPIFPLVGKLPPPDFAGGFHNATTDADRIEWWWQKWPDANIGWPLPAGLFAWDEDPRHAGDFARHMAELARGRLPFTLRQRTGSGGLHWIFRVPAGVKVRQGAAFLDGCDTRAAGKGYIAVAPSIHPTTGRPYEWNAIMDPVEPSDWLVELVREREVERREYVPTSTATNEHERCTCEMCAQLRAKKKPPKHSKCVCERCRRIRYAAAVLRGEARRVTEAGKGMRNDTLNRAWWRVLQFRDVVPESEVRHELARAAMACGLSEREALRVLR